MNDAPVRVLALIGSDGNAGNANANPQLMGFLAGTGRFAIETTADPDRLHRLEGFGVVLAQPDGRPLTPGQANALADFVRAGGGLVSLAAGAEGWQQNPCFRELLGVGGQEDGGLTPPAEIIVRQAAPEHRLLARLEPEFVVFDRCRLRAVPPADAVPLLRLSWRYEQYPIAYTRPYGAGRVVAVELAGSAGTLAHPAFRQFVYRALRHAAGRAPGPAVGVAMIGYGAIGHLHGTAVRAVPGLELVAVCDRRAERRDEAARAFADLRAYADLEDVAADPDVALAIISTPPNTHAEVALRLLRAGKHVVVEKPFALTTREADAMITLASEYGRTLTVFQSRRWDADYLAIKRVVEAGALGEVFHLETFNGSFAHPCDYWHSHEPISGGLFYDWGAHYLDWILNLVPGRVRRVTASAHKRVWHDVTNADQARVLLRFEDGAEAEFIHSDVAAALKPKWYILGTRGALVADWRYESVKSRAPSGDLIEEPFAASESPSVVRIHLRDADGIHVQQLSLPSPPPYAFHRNLADHLIEGEPLAVTPASARRNIAVLEAAKYSADHGVIPVDVDV